MRDGAGWIEGRDYHTRRHEAMDVLYLGSFKMVCRFEFPATRPLYLWHKWTDLVGMPAILVGYGVPLVRYLSR